MYELQTAHFSHKTMYRICFN